MNSMSPLRWTAIAPLTVLLSLAGPLAAQDHQHAASPAAATVPATPPLPRTTPGVYVTEFKGYQRFTDDKVAPWKDSNEAVRQAGGWRAYAREAAAPETPVAKP